MRTYDSESIPTYRKVAGAIAIICTALVGVLEIKDASAGSVAEKDAFRIAQDAGVRLEQRSYNLFGVGVYDVEEAVSEAEGAPSEAVVTEAWSDTDGAHYTVSVSGSEACLALAEQQVGDGLDVEVEVSAAVTSGACP